MVYLEIQLTTSSTTRGKLNADELERIARVVGGSHKNVEFGIPSSLVLPSGDAIDSVFLISKNERVMDSVANDLSDAFQQLNTPSGVKIILIKRKKNNSEYYREILPKIQLLWSGFHRNPPLSDEDVQGWPNRIHYLIKVSRKYYSIGGNDVVSVFQNDEDLFAFIDRLNDDEKEEFKTVASRIVKNNDNKYIETWFNATDARKIPWPQTHALYFLALLSRLREAGFFDSMPNVASAQFVDWNAMGG